MATHTIFMSSDLELAGAIGRLLTVAFQIEFNFCDAKQHFGLKDFKISQ